MEYDSLYEWANASGQETEQGRILGIQADPLLKGPFVTDITDPYQLNTLSGYTLKPDSPLRDKGLNINSVLGLYLPAFDFYGNPVPLGAGVEPGICEIK
jgi:hypothetical protein